MIKLFKVIAFIHMIYKLEIHFFIFYINFNS